MIEFQGVSMFFGKRAALRDISATFEQGQTYALLGTSGCGKSTMLKLMLGLLEPSEGVVLFDGDQVGSDNREFQRRRVGYVIQSGGLFPHLTAKDNVALVAEFLGWRPARIESRVNELAQLVKLTTQDLGHLPRQLSGGQQQRVSLMRALMLDPPVLLMDEPLGALDPIIRRELQDELKQIFESLNKTVVLVTHDLHEAAFFADQILLLHDGCIVQRGPFRELVDAPVTEFVRRFVQAQQSPVIGEES